MHEEKVRKTCSPAKQFICCRHAFCMCRQVISAGRPTALVHSTPQADECPASSEKCGPVWFASVVQANHFAAYRALWPGASVRYRRAVQRRLMDL